KYTEVITGTKNGISWTITPQDDYGQRGFSGSEDQSFQISLSIPAGKYNDVELGFGSDLDENFNNESFGIDNVEVIFDNNDTTPNRRFGADSSLISEGHYLVASDPTDKNLEATIYNFRQRGPEWNPIDVSVTPERLDTAKFGVSVDIDGKTAVVGAQDYDDTGAAFIYTKQDDQWTLKTTLQPQTLEIGDKFGSSVAIRNNTVVVGAAQANNAYVFERLPVREESNSNQVKPAWRQTNLIEGGNFDSFGAAVDVDTTRMVIGAPDSEKAFVFQSSLSNNRVNWNLEHTLDSNANDFGAAVTLDQETIAVGAPAAGQVQVYDLDKIDSPDTLNVGGNSDRFGHAIDLSGDWLVVGAPGDDNDTGTAYTFQRDNNQWQQDQEININSSNTGDFFGHDVAIDNDKIVIGAYGHDLDDKTDSGAAYAYGYKGGKWGLETAQTPLGGEGAGLGDGDQLGYAVAISGSLAILGAPQLEGRPGNEIDTNGAGRIYFRDVSEPRNIEITEVKRTVLEGDEGNVLKGTLGDPDVEIVEISDFNFFDMGDVKLKMGDAADQFTVEEPGLTAVGLQHFTVETNGGDDEINIKSDNIGTPSNGQFIYTGDNPENLQNGETIPASELEAINGETQVNAGGDTKSDRVNVETDADFELTKGKLTINNQDEVKIAYAEELSLKGGDGDNVIKALSWYQNGNVSLDGGNGSDQVEANLSEVPTQKLEDTGTEGNDQLLLFGNIIREIKEDNRNYVSAVIPSNDKTKTNEKKSTTRNTLHEGFEGVFNGNNDNITGVDDAQTLALNNVNDDLLNGN
ncbi:UNVERIFIED_CONTAM: hypothetical protein BEN50_17195, partial [Euhalothece sp. KZN 001]